MAKLDDDYHRKMPVIRRAAAQLLRTIRGVAAEIEDRALVRAEVRGARIKSISSLASKAKAKGWAAGERLGQCGDLVGARVVCNNIEDVYRFVELLKEALPSSPMFEMQDQITEPHPSGYRAVHINCRIDGGSHPFAPELVGCEVQIRSRVQDAFAELSHDDIYKNAGLPEDLRGRARDLGELLSAADRIASDIRRRVSQVTVPPFERPSLDWVSREGLALVFREQFGKSPPDYVIQQALNLCQTLSVASLAGLPVTLARDDLRTRMNEAYSRIAKMPLSVIEVFLASLYSVASGDERAIEHVEDLAKRDWAEIEAFADAETLSSLPDSIDDLIELLDGSDSEPQVIEWADALGGIGQCASCCKPIVDPDEFADRILEHYEIPDEEGDRFRTQITQAIRRSDLEIGGWCDDSLCAYHADTQ